MTGGNDESNNPGTTDYTIVAANSGTVSFDWNYSTNDALEGCGGFCDPFQFLLNNTPTTLISSGGGISQSGTFSTSVVGGDIFGFRIATTDNTGGSASATISNFNAPDATPVPFDFSPAPGLVLLGGAWVVRKGLKKKSVKVVG